MLLIVPWYDSGMSTYLPLLTVSTHYALVLWILVTLVFFFAQYKRDNSIMDIVYGPLFLVAGLGTLFLSGTTNPLSLIILTATALWSLRLGTRIYKKNNGHPEDARYAAWRTLWSERGQWYFMLRSYLQINLLQGFIICIVSLPFILSIAYGSVTPLHSGYTLLGLAIFLLGLGIESVADFQLDRFIARKKAGTETANLMTTGLFRYSRRPNYFGETLIWWGLALMVFPLPYGWLALISPITITYIVTKVTGPMLEKIFLERSGDEYRAYMKKTSYFIPLPPRN